MMQPVRRQPLPKPAFGSSPNLQVCVLGCGATSSSVSRVSKHALVVCSWFVIY